VELPEAIKGGLNYEGLSLRTKYISCFINTNNLSLKKAVGDETFAEKY